MRVSKSGGNMQDLGVYISQHAVKSKKDVQSLLVSSARDDRGWKQLILKYK